MVILSESVSVINNLRLHLRLENLYCQYLRLDSERKLIRG